MIADDCRRSRIADDRKESCFHIIADDRRAGCSHTFRSAEMSNVHARCARGKILANNIADKFTSSFSPEATTSSSSKAKETSVLSSKNIHEETKTWGFPHTAES